jgi:hypothetical protein
MRPSSCLTCFRRYQIKNRDVHDDIWNEFLISVLDERSVSRSSRFIPRKQPTVSIGQETEWAPEPIWMLGRREWLSSTGNRTSIHRSSRTYRAVACRKSAIRVFSALRWMVPNTRCLWLHCHSVNTASSGLLYGNGRKAGCDPPRAN